jgi:hypothetical protein
MLLEIKESPVRDRKLPMLLDREPPAHAAQLFREISYGLPSEHPTPSQALKYNVVHMSVLLGTSPEHFHPENWV